MKNTNRIIGATMLFLLVSAVSIGCFADTGSSDAAGPSFSIDGVSYSSETVYVSIGGTSTNSITVSVWDQNDSWVMGSCVISSVPGEGYISLQLDNGTYRVSATQDGSYYSDETYLVVSDVPTYTITATAGTGGSISPATATVNSGGSQTFTITASSGYAISDVKVDGTSVGALSSYTFTNVTANRTISATFVAVVQYTITATAGTGGSISPATATVNSGGSQTFTVSVDSGYKVDKVLVDGEEVSLTNGKYTFTNVTSDHTISVSFVKDPISIWVYVAIAVVIIAVIGVAIYFFVVRNH